jgi:hypothetical protein
MQLFSIFEKVSFKESSTFAAVSKTSGLLPL